MSTGVVETVGLGMLFEQLKVGDKFKAVGRTVQYADICPFINLSHMTELLFTDVESVANESDIKGGVAPAALVCTFAEGPLMQATMQKTSFAFLGMTLLIFP
jgi:hypothetical protein